MANATVDIIVHLYVYLKIFQLWMINFEGLFDKSENRQKLFQINNV